MYKVAIDLTWLRHGVVGGTESYSINLIEGFISLDNKDIHYYLLTAKDNCYLFEKYSAYKNITILKLNLNSTSKVQRILWHNLAMAQLLNRNKIFVCIEPVYLKPFIRLRNVHFITTIHDLQAYHYPEYFSKLRVAWMKLSWKRTVKTSDIIIVTSNHAKKDLAESFNAPQDKLFISYDPVVIDANNICEDGILENLGVKKKQYYYMVTSLLPHKNVDTILKCLAELKERGADAYIPLVVSGVGGKSQASLLAMAKELNIADHVIITPFINEDERNYLYKYAKAFLAPSLFEGFGMPPIEAMLMGTSLISTYETCSYEISGGLGTYVKNARDPKEWADVLEQEIKKVDSEALKQLTAKYTKEYVAGQFNELIKNLYLDIEGGNA